MDILTAVQVYLEDQGIGANLTKHKDGYHVIHCPSVGEHGVNVHINFAIECCDNGDYVDVSLEDLTNELAHWE